MVIKHTQKYKNAWLPNKNLKALKQHTPWMNPVNERIVVYHLMVVAQIFVSTSL